MNELIEKFELTRTSNIYNDKLKALVELFKNKDNEEIKNYISTEIKLEKVSADEFYEYINKAEFELGSLTDRIFNYREDIYAIYKTIIATNELGFVILLNKNFGEHEVLRLTTVSNCLNELYDLENVLELLSKEDLKDKMVVAFDYNDNLNQYKSLGKTKIEFDCDDAVVFRNEFNELEVDTFIYDDYYDPNSGYQDGTVYFDGEVRLLIK